MAQQKGKDSTIARQLENVVVTATRSERKLGNVAIPTQVISAQMIKATGSLRLQDILQEQTGLTVVNNPLGISLAGFPNLFGAGIQMQGLDPAYTLILIDGEPLVGRNAGILKLGRIAVGNIKQVEIVKGPSSSLYGADAMAGVINIITEKPVNEKAAFQVQRATHNTWSMSGNYENRINKTGVQIFANRYSTSGYDLDKTIYGKTADPFTDQSFAVKITQVLSQYSQFIMSARYFSERQQNNYQVADPFGAQNVKGATKETDWGVNLQFLQQLKNAFKLTTRVYFNQYNNNSYVYLLSSHNPYDSLRFLQQIVKPEIQIERIKEDSKYTAGAGVSMEAVDASRYDTRHNYTTFYFYTQQEWKLKEGYTLIAGARMDKRNDFAWRFSPKMALSGKINDKIFLTASAGMGYRTPDVRQSYAFFTNNSVGYTLLGANILKTGLQKLKEQGQIDPSADISSYKNAFRLNAETSIGLNLGIRYTPIIQLAINGNIFRNDLRNLIDRFTLPFQKNNGQSVYSYENVNKVFTEGLVADVSWKLNAHFILSGGYQYLVAKDKDVIEGIKKDQYLKRDPITYKTDTVRLHDYGGLLNRSRHTANLKLMYLNETSAVNAWLRINYTGRFGYTEKNGSGILDDDSEYENGFLLCNLAISKRIGKRFEIQPGIENLFNYIKPVLLPNLAGRIFFVNFNFQFDKISKNKKQI